MGWEATGDSWAGGQPGRDPGSPGLPAAGFEHGGAWAGAVPSAALAAALESAAGPDGLYDGAGTDALVGIAKQWAAIESWAGAGKLAALRAMTREDADGTPRLRRRPDLPGGWDDSLTYESPAPWARCRRGTSPPWPGRWAPGWPASAGSWPRAPSRWRRPGSSCSCSARWMSGPRRGADRG